MFRNFTLNNLYGMDGNGQEIDLQELPKGKSKTNFVNQKEVFEYVWRRRPHVCEITGRTIHEPQARCFAHVLGKGMHKAYKLDPNNIILVFGPDEHREVDRLASGKKYLLEQYLIGGKRITVDLLKTL